MSIFRSKGADMKRLKIVNPKLAFLIITMIAASFVLADPSCAGMSDKTNRLPDKQPVVFSPSYVNTTMENTIEIMNQANKYRNSIENSAKAIRDKLSKDLAEDSSNKVTLELKKKTGGTGGNLRRLSVTSSDNVTEENLPAESGEIPITVRNAIQKFLNEQGVVREHYIKPVAGEYMVFWNETEADSSQAIKGQLFDSVGAAIPFDSYNIVDNMYTASIKEITELTNGNLAVFWDEATAYNKSSLRMRIFDAQSGKLLSNPYVLSSNTSFSNSIENISTLSNGNLAISWGEYGRTSKMQIFDIEKNEFLSNPYSFSNTSGIDNLTTLSNGDFAIFWQSGGLKGQMFDTQGNMLSDPYIITSGYREADIDTVVNLSDGTFAVFYGEQRYKNGKYTLKVQTFDDEWNALLSSPRDIGTAKSCVYVENVTALSDGKYAVFFKNAQKGGKSSLGMQIFDAEWNTLIPGAYSLSDGNSDSSSVHSVTALADGTFVVCWKEAYSPYNVNTCSIKMQIFDSEGNTAISDPYEIVSRMPSASISSVTALSDGNFAVLWDVAWSRNYSFEMQIFDSRGNELLAHPYTITGVERTVSVSDVKILSDGNLAIIWQEGDYTISGWKHSLKAQVLDMEDNAFLSETYSFADSVRAVSLDNITTLSDGNFAVFWRESGASYNNSSLKSQILDSSGKSITFDSFAKSISDAAANRLAQSMSFNWFLSPYAMPYLPRDMMETPFEFGSGIDLMNEGKLGDIFKGLLANKNMLIFGSESDADSVLLAKIVKDALRENALAAPIDGIDSESIRMAAILASIIKNPTEDQMLVLDVIAALMDEVNKQNKESSSPELNKAADDLVQAVAAVLVAQAIPDLLSEGDLFGIKNIFDDLYEEKARIMLEYQEATKGYYLEMAEDMKHNMAMLRMNNILPDGIDLDRLSRNEMDKIIERLRRLKDKPFDIEYMLKKEARYRKAYLDPGRKMLEDRMKLMMKDFTKRISLILADKKMDKKAKDE